MSTPRRVNPVFLLAPLVVLLPIVWVLASSFGNALTAAGADGGQRRGQVGARLRRLFGCKRRGRRGLNKQKAQDGGMGKVSSVRACV